MMIPLWAAGMNLLAAAGLGAAIGLERQWRQRLAGLRTNTLVALGAATFMLVGRLIGDDGGAARMGAQVVSGIGFLGAGVIFNEGLNVRGLNTAATLWCSAAVGLLAGSGLPTYGGLCAGLVIGSNLILRPLVQAINRQPLDDTEAHHAYTVLVVCRGLDEQRIREMLLEDITATPQLHLIDLESSNIEDTDRVEVRARVVSPKRREIALEHIVGRLCLDTGVSRAGWTSQTQAL